MLECPSSSKTWFNFFLTGNSLFFYLKECDCRQKRDGRSSTSSSSRWNRGKSFYPGNRQWTSCVFTSGRREACSVNDGALLMIQLSSRSSFTAVHPSLGISYERRRQEWTTRSGILSWKINLTPVKFTEEQVVYVLPCRKCASTRSYGESTNYKYVPYVDCWILI